MEKKAKDFLVSAKLGNESYNVPAGDAARRIDSAAPEKETVMLDIEREAIPEKELDRRTGRLSKGDAKSIFKRLDDAVRAMGSISARQKGAFYRLLAIMVDAGVSLVQSLVLIAEQTQNAAFKKALLRIGEYIEQGGKLSGGMELFPKIFGNAEVGMVQSGEASGQMNQVLRNLASQVEKTADIQRRVKGAMIYPSIIMLVLITVIVGMMVMVVPKMTGIFSTVGADLPMPTRILIAISDFFVQRWPIALGVVLLFVFAIGMSRKTQKGRYYLDWIIIHLPLFGPLARKGILARFTRMMANLMASGIPIIRALQINSDALGNEVYRERVQFAAEDLSRGIPLGENLRDSPLFPPLLVQMVTVGEQTASLDTISLKVSDYYEEEVDAAIEGLSKAFEPIILIVAGISIGGVVAAIMLPIIQLVSVSEVL